MAGSSPFMTPTATPVIQSSMSAAFLVRLRQPWLRNLVESTAAPKTRILPQRLVRHLCHSEMSDSKLAKQETSSRTTLNGRAQLTSFRPWIVSHRGHRGSHYHLREASSTPWCAGYLFLQRADLRQPGLREDSSEVAGAIRCL